MFKRWIQTSAIVVLAGALMVGCSTSSPNQPKSPSATPTAPAKPAKQYNAPPKMTIDVNKTYFATLKTTKGDIKIELFPKESPATVNNFVFLAKDHFYDGVKFHRVIKDFMIQTGDPLGNGTGGPGYEFKDELPIKRPYMPGVVAMANHGPNTNGSQFFICSGDKSMDLTAKPDYTIFGYVAEGMSVVHDIENTAVTKDMPVEDILIKSVTIEEK